jgi:3-dehydroquinate synthetase
MVAESRIAERIGWIGPDVTERLIRLLEQIGLPTAAPLLDADELIDAMGRDKKNKDGRVRFVLPRRLGHVELTDAPIESDIRAALASLT